MKIENETRQPPIVANHSEDTLVLTDFPGDYNKRAGKHQRAITQLLREQENDTTDFDSAPPMLELDPKAWDAICAHSNAIADAECTFVPSKAYASDPGTSQRSSSTARWFASMANRSTA